VTSRQPSSRSAVLANLISVFASVLDIIMSNGAPVYSTRETPSVNRSVADAAAIGDAINGERTMALLPGHWRNRRKCHCGCDGKQSHGGYADGIAMTGGCEWAMRYRVNHGELPTTNKSPAKAVDVQR
jgi:hypothetical protein